MSKGKNALIHEESEPLLAGTAVCGEGPRDQLEEGKNAEPVVAVFFSYRVSLSQWQLTGLGVHHGRILAEVARGFRQLVLVTYGASVDATVPFLASARVLTRPWWCPPALYAIAAAFIHWRVLLGTDVWYALQMSGSIPMLCARWCFRKPLVVRAGFPWSEFLAHQGLGGKAWVARMIERWALHRAHRVIVTTEQLRRQGVRHAPPGRFTVVPNAVDCDLFAPADRVLTEARRRICAVGRLCDQKNFPLLFQALVGVPAVEMVVIGDGPDRRRLEVLARELGLPVTFVGRVAHERVADYLRDAELFVLASKYEGDPKALLEAMACGLPVIVSDIPEHRCIVRPEATGVLSALEPEALRQHILRVLDDPLLAERLGGAARRWIEEHRSLTRLAARERAVLLDAVMRNSRAIADRPSLTAHRADTARYYDPRWCYYPLFWSKVRWVLALSQRWPTAARVLDVGCGDGIVGDLLAARGFRVVGVDCRLPDRPLSGTWLQADACHLPFPDASFDVVLALDIVEHLSVTEQPRLVQECLRVLQSHPRARLVCALPNLSHLMSRLKFMFTGRFERTAPVEKHPGDRPWEEYRGLLQAAGASIHTIRGLLPTIPGWYQLVMRWPRWWGWSCRPMNRMAALPGWSMTVLVECGRGHG